MRINIIFFDRDITPDFFKNSILGNDSIWIRNEKLKNLKFLIRELNCSVIDMDLRIFQIHCEVPQLYDVWISPMRSADTVPERGLYDAYKIIFFDGKTFTYQSIETGEQFTVKKVPKGAPVEL